VKSKNYSNARIYTGTSAINSITPDDCSRCNIGFSDHQNCCKNDIQSPVFDNPSDSGYLLLADIPVKCAGISAGSGDGEAGNR
jgi:hypothetical protein